ncbi:DUF2637 domain-containing protein [Tsukamurella hominis]|uniref:DUF2637 domain-containing protein n=1 Tax=Tsukamurella hominis TaxID=1970232 RepID=UPI0039E93F41
MSTTTTAAHPAGPGVRAAALTLTAAVAIGAFAVSFHALSDFAARNAVPAHLAWIWAVVVDATILAGTLAHVALPDARRPKVIFFGGTAVSIAANAAHAWPAGGAAVAVAIVPPVALAVLVEQCIDLARTRRRAPEPEVTVPTGPSGDAGDVLELGDAAPGPEATAVGGGTVRPLFPAGELAPTVDLTVGWRDGAPRGRGAGRVRAA